ncbi:MAG: GNAT family N-acetyltransferase [Inquilinus sp.]|nr:GNAT family N-acetyltransferase [Inquilinus sp.]
MARRDGSIDPPVLETPRLRMRPHRADDFEDLAAMWTEPAVIRYLADQPSTRQDSWARLLRYIGHWQALPYGYWAVEDKATGGFVGEVGLADFRRDIEPPLDGVPEIGWILRTAAHGRGLASEAVTAALAWADAALESDRTVCLIDPGNTASLRVAGKHGYREYARTTYNGGPTMLLARPRGG